MSAAGLAVAAAISWFADIRVRRVGVCALLALGLWSAARGAFPQGDERTAFTLVALGLAALALAAALASVADRRAGRMGPSPVPAEPVRPQAAGVAIATVAVFVAAFAGHVAALLLAAVASGWGMWLAVPAGRRPVPLAAVVVTLLAVPCLWLFVAISGPEGLGLSALSFLPISPAAERVLGLLLFAMAIVLAGPWPFPQAGDGLLTAPVGAMLLTRLALPAVGTGLLHWRPAAFPLLVIGMAGAAFAGRLAALLVLGAFIGLASLEPIGARGAGWLLTTAIAVALAGSSMRHATTRLTLAVVAWLGALDVMTGGLSAEVVYTTLAAALAGLGLLRAASRPALTPLPPGSIFARRRGKSFQDQQLLSPEESVTMAFTLPPLPYAYDALEPHIDEQTMRIHHDKHHAAYVNNLNAALESHPDLQKKSVEELIGNLDALPEAVRGPVRNNGGGHVNHTMFWEIMAPGGAKEPAGALAQAIDKAFGGFGQFKEQFAKACVGRFGSGWGWLVADKSGGLTIESTPNQDSPLMSGKLPILGCDVWEHAYYLKYQNRRPDYVSAWWNAVNWSEVGKRYDAARTK